MTNDQIRNMAMGLLKADTEQEAIGILTKAGFWDNPAAWRLYGDSDGNYATIGNQQSRPEAALVEKVVNSVDARLMAQCMRLGLDPTSATAPASIRHAVSRFFEGRELDGEIGGTVDSWPRKRQLEESQHITIAATGSKQAPSLTIADRGEGQSPARMPDTFLSIHRTNKLRIPFVQGKFNMGGTGVLKFGGPNRLQLIISRRDPELAKGEMAKDSTAGHWGFTIVRRERPGDQAGQVRNSVFRYLAPIKSNDVAQGNILSFSAPRLPLMPDGNEAYARDVEWGSAIKLYEYDMRGFKSHVLMSDGLLFRLELLLPEIALPVRVHECRSYRGHEGSFANTLVGLTARLNENRGGNLEPGYPTSVPLTVHGERMIARIYAFKSGKADTYRTNEGIIFTINGQTHGAIPKTFFSRNRVKMGRLASSLLVVVDCTKLSVTAREDLFMNSRDRLSNGDLRKSIEDELEDLIGKHPGLRELRERRRGEEIAERLEDSRPLEQVLDSILRSSPSLAKLFLLGQRLSRPHRTQPGTLPGGGQGTDEGAGVFNGKTHPTFFRFFRKRTGEDLNRNCEIGRRCRIKFETDVENEYFSRANNRGRYHVELADGPLAGTELDNSLTLHNGIANWSVTIPEEGLAVGDVVAITCSIEDDVIPSPLVNVARLTIQLKGDEQGRGGSRRSSSSGGDDGEEGSGPNGRSGSQGPDGTIQPGGLQMPNIVQIRESDWAEHKFDERSACKIVDDGSAEDGKEQSNYTFYVNMDNVYLRTDIKDKSDDVGLTEAKFKFGNVLVGLALIHDVQNRKGVAPTGREDADSDAQTVEDSVAATTRALAPFLVPMINYLGTLSPDEMAAVAQAGDED